MTKWRIQMACMLVLVSASACGGDDDDSGDDTGDDTGTGAGSQSGGAGQGGDGAAAGGFEADYRTSSAFVTRASGLVMGSSPHGFTQTWYSAALDSMLDSSSFTAPVGTTAIKEFASSADGPVEGIAVMVKREAGYDAANGDWYYEMRDASGALLDSPMPGPVGSCIGCHQAFAATDYLGATAVR